MVKDVGKKAAKTTPAASLIRREGWKLKCTHSCRRQKTVLLAAANPAAAATSTAQCGARLATQRQARAAEMAAVPIAMLRVTGTASAVAVSGAPSARSGNDASGGRIGDRTHGGAVPAHERRHHSAGGQDLLRGELRS